MPHRTRSRCTPVALDFAEWIRYGMAHGYCCAPVCATHDGLLTEDDDVEDDEYLMDMCIPALRLLADAAG